MPEATVEYSFSASGWLFIYQLGVALSLRKHNLHLNDESQSYSCQFVGSSGGSLVSACLATEIDILPIKDYFLECVKHCKSNPKFNMFKMREYCKGAFKMATDETTHELEAIRTGRLNVSVTLLPSGENAIINSFENAQELEEAILASCTMTPLAGFPFRLNRPNDPELHNKWVFDGGLSQVQPETNKSHKQNTKRVTCSPFYFWDCDIKPSKYVPIHWGMYPPSVEEMEDLFWLGVSDSEEFIRKNIYWLKDARIPNTIRPVSYQHQLALEQDCSSSSDECDTSDECETLRKTNSVIVIPRNKEKQENENENQSENQNNYLFAQAHPSLVSVQKPFRFQMASHRQAQMQQFKVAALKTPMQSRRISPDGWYNKTFDGLVVFTQRACLKPLAVSAVYVELCSMAWLNAAHAVVASAENKRRSKIEASRHLFSIRRWVPEKILGSSEHAVNNAKDCVNTIAKPWHVWSKLDQKPKFESVQDDCALSKHSYIYRSLHSLALL